MNGGDPTTHDTENKVTHRLFFLLFLFPLLECLLCFVVLSHALDTQDSLRIFEVEAIVSTRRAILRSRYRAHDSLIMASQMLRPLASSAAPASASELCASSFFIQKQLKGHRVQGKLKSATEAHTS